MWKIITIVLVLTLSSEVNGQTTVQTPVRNTFLTKVQGSLNVNLLQQFGYMEIRPGAFMAWEPHWDWWKDEDGMIHQVPNGHDLYFIISMHTLADNTGNKFNIQDITWAIAIMFSGHDPFAQLHGAVTGN